MKIFCFDPGKQKNIMAGEYNPSDYTFIKKVTKRHFFIKLRTYAIQEEVINNLNKLGCKEIHIKTKKKLIITKIEDWLNSPIYDFNHGRQYFLGGNKNGQRQTERE